MSCLGPNLCQHHVAGWLPPVGRQVPISSASGAAEAALKHLSVIPLPMTGRFQ